MASSSFKTCLVLSGGAARAVAHIGVLEQLQKSGIHVDMIVGTSMGAIIGALYAIYGDSFAVAEQIIDFVNSNAFQEALDIASEESGRPAQGPFDRFFHHVKLGFLYTRSLARISLVSLNDYDQLIRQLIPDRTIESLPIPFAAIATDISTGEEVVMTKGSLITAIQATAAIPGILPPITRSNRRLVDGGWVDNVPVSPAIRLGAHYVIAVDASWEIRELHPTPESALELAFRSNDISRMILNRLRRAAADTLLIPDVWNIQWSDFSKTPDCIDAGRTICAENLWRIRRRSLKRKLISFNGWFHPARRGRAWRYPLVIE